MSAPTPQEQLQFLTKLQRLLSEGQFVATYKYALILALADLSVEKGDDSGVPLKLSTHEIAQKLIHYYWRQADRYEGRFVLRQNKGAGQADIITRIIGMRKRHEGSLASAQAETAEWRSLVSSVARVVEVMPLWKLQTVGRERIEFLYQNVGRGHDIELMPGVAYAFRLFHALIGDLVRGSWLTHVRRFNRQELGTATDLQEFLFGSERADSQGVRRMLGDLQEGRCFYCRTPLTPKGIHIDHFIPWSRYQADLGHNFVLADDRCNAAKSDRLASIEHLSGWLARNREHRAALEVGFDQAHIVHDEGVSRQVARWAYATTAMAGGHTWFGGRDFRSVPPDWEQCFDRST